MRAVSLINEHRFAEALTALDKADIVWDKNSLDRFIANPDAVVPGNNMKPYGGIASAEERAKIIAFLESGVNR